MFISWFIVVKQKHGKFIALTPGARVIKLITAVMNGLMTVKLVSVL